MNTLGVLVELGAASASAHGPDLRHVHDYLFGNEAHAGGLGQGDPRVEHEVDGERAFVEGRQERTRKRRCGDGRCQHGNRRRCHDGARVLEGAIQNGAIAPFEQPDQGAVSGECPRARQHVIRHDRRKGDGDDEACQNGNDVGLSEWREQPAFDARQREQRNKDQHDDHRRVDDAGAHFLRRGHHDVEDSPGASGCPVLPQAAKDVLHVDDRIVDEFADGNRQSSERHCIDRESGEMKDRRCGEDGNRYGGERDRRRSPVQEKGEEHDGHHDDRLEQHHLEIVNGRLDEVGLAEQDLIGFHPGREASRRLLQALLDFACQDDRIDAGLLFHGDNDGWFPHVTRVSALELRRKLDLGDLAQVDRRVASRRHHQIAQVVQAGAAADVADQVFARILVRISSSGIDAELRQRAFKLVVADAQRPQRRRIGRDAVLPDFAPNRDHLRDAGNGEQARAEHEIRSFAQLHRAGAVAGDGDQQYLAHDGADRAHDRTAVGGKLVANDGQALRDQLPIAIDVGAPVEFDIDDRQADTRYRADPDDPGHAVHLGLDRKAHELLDLQRGQALRLGHDGHRRAVEVGKDVDRQPRHGERAVDDKDGCKRQHDQPVAQGLGDQESEHRPPSLAHLVEELGALGHDAHPRLQAGDDQHPVAVERLDPNRARFEPLGRAVLEHEILTVLAAHDTGARNRNALLLLRGRGQHGDELAGAQPAGVCPRS